MKFSIRSSYSLVLITIFACFGAISANDLNCDIIKDPKDDCGNICGQLNTKITKSNCGDPDKRGDKVFLIHDPKDHNKEDETEYFEPRYYECVSTCPSNYKMFESTQFCVKDVNEFGILKKGCDKEEESSNLLVILLSVFAGILALAGAAFAYYKKVFNKKNQNESPEVRASEVGLTKNNSV